MCSYKWPYFIGGGPLFFCLSLGLQIAQSKSYLETSGPKVGTICILGALGYVFLGDLGKPQAPSLGSWKGWLELKGEFEVTAGLFYCRPVPSRLSYSCFGRKKAPEARKKKKTQLEKKAHLRCMLCGGDFQLQQKTNLSPYTFTTNRRCIRWHRQEWSTGKMRRAALTLWRLLLSKCLDINLMNPKVVSPDSPPHSLHPKP